MYLIIVYYIIFSLCPRSSSLLPSWSKYKVHSKTHFFILFLWHDPFFFSQMISAILQNIILFSNPHRTSKWNSILLLPFYLAMWITILYVLSLGRQWTSQHKADTQQPTSLANTQQPTSQLPADTQQPTSQQHRNLLLCFQQGSQQKLNCSCGVK